MDRQSIKTIEPGELLAQTGEMKNGGFRLVAISCTNSGDMELSYSFDRGYELLTLRCLVPSDAEIESISGIYPFAFLYENEIKELFGVKIKNISLDFHDKLYKTAVKTPFGKEAE